MRRVSYEIRFVTPAFIGGSDQAKAELTANGIRGHLRWWLRAVAGGRFAGNLARVSALETSLFGATEQQSALRVVVTKHPQFSMAPLPQQRGLKAADIANRAGLPAGANSRLKVKREGEEDVPTNPIGYLGFGPVSWKGTTNRQYVMPEEPSAFFIQYRGLDAESAEILGDAVWAWMNLGAIGSRSRRGFGSFVCSHVERSGNSEQQNDSEVSPVCPDTSTFDSACRALFQRNVPTNHAQLAEWSHISSSTVVFRAAGPLSDWAGAMTAASAWLIAFRRRYGMGVGTDYDWLKAANATGIPHRAGFGLPLPFGKGDLVVNWRGGRRASPLLVRIAKLGAGFYPVFTHLPARFLPEGKEITFRKFRAQPTTDQSRIVSDFLEELASRGRIARVV